MSNDLFKSFKKTQEEMILLTNQYEMLNKKNLDKERRNEVEKLISVKEASDLTGIPAQRLRGLAKSNKNFPAVYCGNRLYIIKSRLNEFFNENIGLVM